MGAMLIGMATGFAAMFFVVVIQIIIALVLFIDARRHKMNALSWAVAGFLLNFWTVAVYIGVRIRMCFLKCPQCGAKIKASADYCPECYKLFKKFDDGAIAKKFILLSYPLMIVLMIIEELLAAFLH